MSLSTSQSLEVNFSQDTETTVSRRTLRALSEQLGLNESDTALFALARLGDEMVAHEHALELEPLTGVQHQRISEASPAAGRVIGSLL